MSIKLNGNTFTTWDDVEKSFSPPKKLPRVT